MHIAIMAAGAIGGYLGARLAEAGEQVSVIARGAHLAAIQDKGISVKSALGDVNVKPQLATENTTDIGPADIVIFAVKLWDTEIAAEACKALIGPDTIVVPFQNGVETVAKLSSVLGKDHIAGGVAYISTAIAGPGVIQHNGEFANFVIGMPGGNAGPRLDAFAGACEKAGVNVAVMPNITAQIWKKLVFFSAFSGLTAASRASLGDIRDDADMSKVFRQAMEETAAVGNAAGAGLDDDVVEAHIEFAMGMPAGTRATMAFDLDAGRKLEAYWLSGAVSRIGEQMGVATPINDTLYAAVKPFVDGKPE